MYMDMALEACKKGLMIQNLSNNTKGLMMQEMAYYESDLEIIKGYLLY